jgi:aspartyl-tRNA(Asn)/glutamyl-tRNA(Gln) amidotransferase subunit C
MHIDINTVEKLAHLARLELDDQTKNIMLSDMNRMLDFVAKLDELDVSDVDPLVYMSDQTNVLRQDVITSNTHRNEALMNAPKHDTDYFRVPKVIEK